MSEVYASDTMKSTAILQIHAASVTIPVTLPKTVAVETLNSLYSEATEAIVNFIDSRSLVPARLFTWQRANFTIRSDQIINYR